jgi:hypothetical protein
LFSFVTYATFQPVALPRLPFGFKFVKELYIKK